MKKGFSTEYIVSREDELVVWRGGLSKAGLQQSPLIGPIRALFGPFHVGPQLLCPLD